MAQHPIGSLVTSRGRTPDSGLGRWRRLPRWEPGAVGSVPRQRRRGSVPRAAPASVPDIMLEEIVITAEKRPEKAAGPLPVIRVRRFNRRALRGANISGHLGTSIIWFLPST